MKGTADAGKMIHHFNTTEGNEQIGKLLISK